MPHNCPRGTEGSCEGCRHNTDDRCYEFFPSIPIIELLTIDERMARLEEAPKPVIIETKKPIPKFTQSYTKDVQL